MPCSCSGSKYTLSDSNDQSVRARSSHTTGPLRFTALAVALSLVAVACSSGTRPQPATTTAVRTINGVFGCPSPPLPKEVVADCMAAHSIANRYELTLPREGAGTVTGTGMIDGTRNLVAPESPNGGCVSRTQIKLRINGTFDGAETINGTLTIDTLPLTGTCPVPMGRPTHDEEPVKLRVQGDTVSGSSGILFFTSAPAGSPASTATP